MTAREVLAAALAALTIDDAFARKTLADMMLEGGFPEADAAAVAAPDLDVLLPPECPQCGVECEPGETEVDYRREEDQGGGFVCRDVQCGHCGNTMATVTLRPVSVHYYSPEFTGPLPVRGVPIPKEAS